MGFCSYWIIEADADKQTREELEEFLKCEVGVKIYSLCDDYPQGVCEHAVSHLA